MTDIVSKFDEPEDRVVLLKAGFSGKAIERLYIERNGYKIICGSLCHN